MKYSYRIDRIFEQTHLVTDTYDSWLNLDQPYHKRNWLSRFRWYFKSNVNDGWSIVCFLGLGISGKTSSQNQKTA